MKRTLLPAFVILILFSLCHLALAQMESTENKPTETVESVDNGQEIGSATDKKATPAPQEHKEDGATITKTDETAEVTDAGKTAEEDAAAGKKPADRPWIIKQKSKGKTQINVQKPSSIEWRNDEQKAQCEAYLTDVKEDFLRARYYSIQGDPCNTANYSKAFLALIEQCRQDCPEGFLEENGYTDGVIRNLELLHKSGTERCLGPAEPVKN